MASEEDALDELRSKSASISTKIKEIKAICVHCNRKVIEFVKCAKCKDIFHPSCLTQAATKKSTLCIHESEISEEISEDPRVLLHIFQVRIQYLESLLSETQSKNSILVQNNELLTEKVRNLESSKKNENQQQKKPESRDKDHSQSQPSHISSMIESTSVVQKSSVNEQKGQNRQSDKLTYSSKVNKGLNSSNKVLKNMLPSTSTTDVTAIPNENYNENKTIVENNKNKDITTPEQINSGWKTVIKKRKLQNKDKIICTGSNNNCGITGALRKKWMYVGKIAGIVKEEDIIDYLGKMEVKDGIEVRKLDTKGSNSAFSVGVASEELFKKLGAPEFWPAGVLVREFSFRGFFSRNNKN